MSVTPRATLILLAAHGSFRRATNGKRRAIGLMSTAGGCWEIGCTLRNSGKCSVSTPSGPEPTDVELDDYLLEQSADSKRREAQGRVVLDRFLEPGAVAHSHWAACAALGPPYDQLPIPRVKIPRGVILSREGNAWMREDRVKHVALPLYEGRMIGQFDYSQKGWVSGKGRGAVWRDVLGIANRSNPST